MTVRLATWGLLVVVLAPGCFVDPTEGDAESIQAATLELDVDDGTRSEFSTAGSDDAKFDEAKFDEAKFDDAKSDDAKSDKGKSDKGKLDEAKSDEASRGHSKRGGSHGGPKKRTKPPPDKPQPDPWTGRRKRCETDDPRNLR